MKVSEPLLREMLAHRKGKDAESDLTADALSKLGQCLLKTEKFAEAETLLRDCHAIRVKKQPTAFNVFNVKSQIGAALLGQKKYADAEPLLVQGYEGMKKADAVAAAAAQLDGKRWLPSTLRPYVVDDALIEGKNAVDAEEAEA